jgi:hypothetical protein
MIPLPNSLLISADYSPVFVGQVFHVSVGFIDISGALTPLTSGQFDYRIVNAYGKYINPLAYIKNSKT